MLAKKWVNPIYLRRALENSLDILDEKTKQVLLYYLTKEFNISFEENCSSFEDIENAMRQLLGEGASIITERMRRELKTMEMQSGTN